MGLVDADDEAVSSTLFFFVDWFAFGMFMFS